MTSSSVVPAGQTVINCGTVCSANYSNGTVVNLATTPAAGSAFAGWSGNADCSDGNITVNAAKTCTASFNLASTTVLGLNSKGAALDNDNNNRLHGAKFLTPRAGGVTNLSVYVGNVDALTAQRQYQLGIYADNAGRPGSLVARTTASGSLTANTWNTLPLSATLQANTNYWLVYNSNGRTTSVNGMYYNVGPSGRGVYSTNPVSFGTWPTTFPASTLTVGIYSIYATLGP